MVMAGQTKNSQKMTGKIVYQNVSICIKLLCYQKTSRELHVFSAASAKVMSGALLGPTGYKATKDNVVSLQMSPDLIGSPFYPNNEPGT